VVLELGIAHTLGRNVLLVPKIASRKNTSGISPNSAFIPNALGPDTALNELLETLKRFLELRTWRVFSPLPNVLTADNLELLAPCP